MKTTLILAAALATAAIIGCGGSGSGTGTGPGGSAGVQVFMTDNLNAGYDHVWVTVDKVELRRQNGSYDTVYDNPNGQTVDLRSLNDNGQPLYSFLTFQNVPADTYTAVRVTMNKDLTLYTTGATTGTAQTFSSTYDSGSGKSAIVFDLKSPRMIAGVESLVIDFDLSQWNVTANGVTAAIQEGDGTGLGDTHRHHREEYRGVVAGLTGSAPDFTFTLNLAHGGALQVKTSSTTGIYTSDGSSPTLANGETVSVRGLFSTTDNALLASSVRIKVGDTDNDPAAAVGLAANLNSGAGTFDLTVNDTRGFVPGSSTVHVVLGSGAILVSDHSNLYSSTADFFAALAANPSAPVVVLGTYDSGSNTLTARLVKLDVENENQNQAEIRGVVAATPAPDAAAGTLSVTITEWEGVSLTNGQTVPVTTSSSTGYWIGQIQATKTDFFAALTAGTTRVQAEGPFDGTTLSATTLRVLH